MIKVELSPDGTEFVLRSAEYNTEINEFFRWFPVSLYDKQGGFWHCKATPGGAWRLATCDRWPVDYPPEVAAMAEILETLPDTNSPPPAICRYAPRKHQLAGYTFAKKRDAAMLAWKMALGKTKTSVDLILNGPPGNVLVVCPKSVIGVWPREIEKHWVPEEVVPPLVVPLEGSAQQRCRAIEKAMLHPAERRIFVTNFAAVRGKYNAKKKRVTGAKVFESLWQIADTAGFEMVIVDESHRIATSRSQQCIGCCELGRKANFRLALTGTPMRKDQLDLFGQFKFLDPGVYGNSYTRFRNHYAVSGHFGDNHIVDYKNEEECARRAGTLMYRVDWSEVDDVSIPDSVHIDVPIALTPKTLKVYREVEQDAIAKVGDGICTPQNALSQLLRLRQVTSGFFQPDEVLEDGVLRDGERSDIVVVGTEKQDHLIEMLRDLDEPVVVACSFTNELQQVREACEKASTVDNPIRYGEVSGRYKDLVDSRMPEDVDVLGVQYQSGGLGIDLTRAAVAILYSPQWSYADFEQFIYRTLRPEQTRRVRFYHFIASGTVDERVRGALEKKENVIEGVFDYLRS